VTQFRLSGEVSSDNLTAVRPVLHRLLESATIVSSQDGLHVEGFMDGTDAADVNRRLLSALRRAEKKTRLRVEWTGEGHIHRFFDYVPKAARPVSTPGSTGDTSIGTSC
jgi:hypothetical protein